MKMKVYSIYDAPLTEYRNVMAFQNDVFLKRYLEKICVNDPDMSKNPQDFVVYQVGDFETEFGTIESIEPRLVCNLSLFFESK